MTSFLRNCISLLCLLLSSVYGIAKGDRKKDDIDWRVTLNHENKTPYATSIVYKSLPYYFPAARREDLTKWFRYTSIDQNMYGRFDSAAMLVMLGLNYFVSEPEWRSVLSFAKEGNEVFLISSRYDINVSRSLCEKSFGGGEEYILTRYNDGSHARNVLKLLPDTSVGYGYYGRALYSSFDTSRITDTLGKGEHREENEEELKSLNASISRYPDVLGLAWGKPNFIRYKVGLGHITLHAAPLAFSNYFLLQPGNRAYLDAIWHSFPANISVIYWNEYYKRNTESSNLGVLTKYPGTRWGLLVTLFTLLLYVLFGLKRMQRIVPIVPPVENASVSFVETVGRLYFNKGQHANLAEKMIQHFLEWVRGNYYLDTTQLNDQFAAQLSAKSGKPLAEVAAILEQIHGVRLGTEVTQEYIYDLHKAFQSFYKSR